MSTLEPAIGKADIERILSRVDNGRIQTPEQLVRELGWHGFLWLIRERLDTLYPAPLFRVEQYGVLWASEHGGEDIDPGVKWATLLDLALEQLPKGLVPELPSADPALLGKR